MNFKDDKEKDNLTKQNKLFTIILYKSLALTFIFVLFVMYGLFFISSLFFGTDDISLLISFIISIIFLIIFCTLNIIEEIKK